VNGADAGKDEDCGLPGSKLDDGEKRRHDRRHERPYEWELTSRPGTERSLIES